MELVSAYEFAKRTGFSQMQIGKLIKKKEFPSDCIVTDKQGKTKLVWEKAKVFWISTRGPLPGETKTTKPEKPDLHLPNEEELESEIKLSNSADKIEADRVKAVIDARTAQLKLMEARGLLVKKSDVYKEWYAVGQEVRAALQGLPDKLIDLILAAGTRQESHSILYVGIVEALEGLQKEIDL